MNLLEKQELLNSSFRYGNTALDGQDQKVGALYNFTTSIMQASLSKNYDPEVLENMKLHAECLFLLPGKVPDSLKQEFANTLVRIDEFQQNQEIGSISKAS